jgi:hypothetical protein
VEQWREQQVAALRAHRSQVDDAMLERFAGFPSPMLAHFICVRSRVPILIPEHDLFAGVPGRQRKLSLSTPGWLRRGHTQAGNV